MPSAVADIGGQRFYAWVTTVYLVASVVAATTVHATLTRLGPRWSYLLGLSVFGAGSLVRAAAPTMEILLVGRTVQGAAGGLLAGLGYAVINTALPSFVVDQGFRIGVSDVGSRHAGRPCSGRPVRPIRFVALGIRCAGDPDRRDGRAGSDRAACTRRRRARRFGPHIGPGVVAAACLARLRCPSAWRAFRTTSEGPPRCWHWAPHLSRCSCTSTDGCPRRCCRPARSDPAR